MAYNNDDSKTDKAMDTGAEESRPNVGAGFSDQELKDLFSKCKRESFDNRWVFERQWMRNIHYVNGRQWIYYTSRHNEWRDIRMSKWIPRPVTNKCKETVQSIRAMFTSVNTGVNVRPNGNNPKNIAVAAIADEYGPVLHEEHHMDAVLIESDFWFIVTGNVFWHTYLDRDPKYGMTTIPFEQCTACGTIYSSDAIAEAGQKCPDCGNNAFTPAVSEETGEPMEKRIPNGRGVTIALSPFELVFPNNYPRFEDVPYVIRLRWRTKEYYEGHPQLKEQTKHFKWQSSPSEQSLHLFRSLPLYNDVGVAPFLNGSSSGGAGAQAEGAPEYELWYKPCDQYPNGLVARFLGDSDPLVLHLEEDEAIPGELPYQDADGQPLFTFSHAAFEQVGGRVYGSGPLDVIIPKQNQLNQLDSMFQMIIQRMSNPLWLVPKGSEIEKFTGEPGLVVKWNPLTVGGNAKPERVAGEGPHGSFFQIREQYLKDIEELAGTFDIIKGQKPTGVEAFSAMQLLVERSQSRFASAFKARGNLYKDWFKFALEIEREFGPNERTMAILSPARTYAYKEFQNAQLQGSFDVVVEDGSNTPKTSLGMRAAIEHLNQLGLINAADPDQRYKILQLFGQPNLSPSLDINTQRALAKQQAFEEWATDDQAVAQSMMATQQEFAGYQQQIAAIPPPDPMSGEPVAALPQPPSLAKNTPLAWKPWYDPIIHKQEFLKWMNSDSMVTILAEHPELEPICVAHLQEIDAALMQAQIQAMGPQPQGQPGKTPGGGGAAMNNSNRESSDQGQNPQKQGQG